MKHAVGQLLYVILSKEMRIFPIVVVEEVTRKTLEGEVKTYIVQSGKDPKSRRPISDIQDEVFDSVERAKQVLIDRFKLGVEQLAQAAVNEAKEWYPSGSEMSAVDDSSFFKTSPAPSPAKKQREPKQRQEITDLQRELLAESDAIVELPNGQKAKIRSVKLPETMQ